MAERQAHNLEVVGSKPTGGILQFVRFKEAHRHMLIDVKHSNKTLYRGGAGAARGAHNPEVTRSRRVSGIISLKKF